MCSNTAIKTISSVKSSPDPTRHSTCQSCVGSTATILNRPTSQNRTSVWCSVYTDYTTMHTNCYGIIHLLYKKWSKEKKWEAEGCQSEKASISCCQESGMETISSFHWHGASVGAETGEGLSLFKKPLFYVHNHYITFPTWAVGIAFNYPVKIMSWFC